MSSPLARYLGDPKMLAEIPVSDVPAVLAELAAVQSALAARLLREPAKTEPAQPSADGFLTVEKAAERLDFTEQYVYGLVRKGSLPVVRHGKYVRIRESDLNAWIDKHHEKGLDKQLYYPYSNAHGRQRTSQNPAGTRPYSGSNGGSNRRGTKHRGAVGTGRVEDIRTRFAADPPPGQCKADSSPQD